MSIDTKPPRRSRLEVVQMDEGDELAAVVRCHVIERPKGPVEVADIECDLGVLLNVPCEAFQFLDEPN